MKAYLGFDARETQGYAVACRSLIKHAHYPVTITPLNASRLAESGLLRRPTDTRGQRYDILSNAAASTEFAISRFLVPFLAQSGWALFADCDVVFKADINELLLLADPKYAVMCVKHDFDNLTGMKMDGQQQSAYPRKLWSSVMLWNCDHPANKRLSLVDVNERPGRDLHALYWLNDSEIGELPAEWNVLAGLQPVTDAAKIVHFTLGTPDLGVPEIPEHKIWWEAYAA